MQTLRNPNKQMYNLILQKYQNFINKQKLQIINNCLLQQIINKTIAKNKKFVLIILIKNN